jgi:ParB/RepB/Spo0J family partition protein
MKVRLDRIKQNPFNTRRDYGDLAGLETSIKRYGFTQPLPARKVGEEYEIAFGGRRLEVAKRLGFNNLDLDVKKVTDTDMALMALIENIHRKDLNPPELARAYNIGLKACKMELKEFSKLIGESATKIREYISILDLPQRILEKSAQYRVHELVGLARLNDYSQSLRTMMENVIQDRTLPQDFFVEIVRACMRTYESNLPEKRKSEICNKILWEDYSKLGHGEEAQVEKFANQILQEAMVHHNIALNKTQKARAAIKSNKKIRSVSDVPNYDRMLETVTGKLREANGAVIIADHRKIYVHASKRGRNKFDYWVTKLAKSLEDILHEKAAPTS